MVRAQGFAVIYVSFEPRSGSILRAVIHEPTTPFIVTFVNSLMKYHKTPRQLVGKFSPRNLPTRRNSPAHRNSPTLHRTEIRRVAENGQTTSNLAGGGALFWPPTIFRPILRPWLNSPYFPTMVSPHNWLAFSVEKLMSNLL